MHPQSHWILSLSFLFGLVLFTIQGQSNPLYTRNNLNTLYPRDAGAYEGNEAGLLIARRAFADLSAEHEWPQLGLMPRKPVKPANPARPATPAKQGRKLPPAKKGICKRKRGPASLALRAPPGNIVDLFNRAAKANKVPVGGHMFFPLDIKKSQLITTSEFYGCTVVVIASGKGVLVGHFSEDGRDCKVMENGPATEKNIIAPLQEDIDLHQEKIENAPHTLIIHSSQSKVGLKKIQQLFEDEGITTKPMEHVYFPSSGTGEFLNVPKGKMVVEWVMNPDGTGATMHIHVEQKPPITSHYDAQGNQC